MKKALEILKHTYNAIEQLGICHISIEYTEKDFLFLEEAVKEIEELENRSCDSCKYFHQGYLCIELGCGSIKPKEIGMKYCDKWVK